MARLESRPASLVRRRAAGRLARLRPQVITLKKSSLPLPVVVSATLRASLIPGRVRVPRHGWKGHRLGPTVLELHGAGVLRSRNLHQRSEALEMGVVELGRVLEPKPK